MNEPLNDLSPMPFGKYKGTPMQDVPASYLCWLWNNTDVGKNKFDALHKYIEHSMSALKLEFPDGIWTKQ